MAQKKAHEVGGWLSKPDPKTRVVLVYGPDRGMVSERARGFAEKTGLPMADPFAVVKFDLADKDADSGRLFDEIAARPLFGGHRLLWIRNAGAQKFVADALKEMLASPPDDLTILVEAGELKKTAPLRKLVETTDRAMALPCYPDEARSIDALIDSELGRGGLTIDPDAKSALRAALGGDRLASRGELEKLVLYCQGNKTVGLADVQASTGDVSALSADDIVDCAMAGRVAALDTRMRRYLAGGAPPFLLLSSAMRQFQLLSVLKHEMEVNGQIASAAVARARPPVFFSRRALVEAALRQWGAASIGQALDRLQATVLQTRRRPELAADLTCQALLALAVHAQARARNAQQRSP
ncbi:MAG: DNA polymerase III subunit delta [Nitratireductor sp.]